MCVCVCVCSGRSPWPISRIAGRAIYWISISRSHPPPNVFSRPAVIYLSMRYLLPVRYKLNSHRDFAVRSLLFFLSRASSSFLSSFLAAHELICFARSASFLINNFAIYELSAF